MRGVCDLITRGAPPLRRTAPNFGGAPKVRPDADSLLRVAADLVDSPDRIQGSAEIRVPPAAPEQPPPLRVPSDPENAPATDDPSDYQPDWYGNWPHTDGNWPHRS